MTGFNVDFDVQELVLVWKKSNHQIHTGIRSFSCIGPKLWNSLPEDVKKLDRLESSKSKW